MDEQAIAARLTAIAERLKAALPGPWHLGPYYKSDVLSARGHVADCGMTRGLQAQRDAELIANAPDDLAFLSAHVETLTQQVAELKRPIMDSEQVDGRDLRRWPDERERALHAERLLREISETLAEAGVPGGTTIHGGVLILRERAELAEQQRDAAHAALRNFGDDTFREGLHATYNGGWHHSEDGLKAFHHGMDTVCNVIASIVKHQLDAALAASAPQKE